jgi:hypothetical protein
MGDAAHDNGVDVEPEAEREHQATLAPRSGADQQPAVARCPRRKRSFRMALAAGSRALPSRPRRT